MKESKNIWILRSSVYARLFCVRLISHAKISTLNFSRLSVCPHYPLFLYYSALLKYHSCYKVCAIAISWHRNPKPRGGKWECTPNVMLRTDLWVGFAFLTGHFTVVCLVTWPMNASEAGDNLASMQSFPLLSFVDSLPFKGQITEQKTVKCFIFQLGTLQLLDYPAVLWCMPGHAHSPITLQRDVLVWIFVFTKGKGMYESALLFQE